MKIEISDKKYWKPVNYNDALLYCAFLNIDGKNDWRMIKDYNEYYNLVVQINNNACRKMYSGEVWFESNNGIKNETIITIDNGLPIWIIPVREIIYDRNK